MFFIFIFSDETQRSLGVRKRKINKNILENICEWKI